MALQVVAARAVGGSSGANALLLTIAVLGLLGLTYTLLGGIRAVVWTECILGTTLLLGGALAAGFLLARMPGGPGAMSGLSEFGEKLRVFQFTPAEGTGWPELLRTTRSFWIGLSGGFVLNLATHGTDQDMVQRMLTCSSWKKGGLSLLVSAALIIPLNVLFLSVGTLLYFYHRLRPETVPPGVSNADDYFLLFIAQEMPTGLAGLVLAGLLAAAVSSHTSVLNALASTSIEDFYRPHLVRGASDRHYLTASRAFTGFWGIVLILVAASFIGSQKNILETALSALTYFYGSLLGVFLLGIFTRRGSSTSATLGMLLAVPVVLCFQVRDFLERPELAPSAVRAVLGALPPAVEEGLRAHVPLLAWPLWIMVGTAVTFAIGALGRPPARAAPAGRPTPATPQSAA
jgi:Na+/proline symporter